MRVLLLACFALLTVRAAAQAPRVRDSAGVRIIENGPRLTAPIVNPIVAARNRIYFANGDAFEIRVFTSDGKLAEIIRTSDALARITDADMAKLPLIAIRAGATSAEIEEARRAAIAKSPTKFWPTVGLMRSDLTGRIWIQEWQSNPDPLKPRAWAAFDSTGRLLGRLMIPGGPREARRFVVSFGRDEVFIRHLDDEGAVHYTAYPILPVRR
jgi:hypothetical protein